MFYSKILLELKFKTKSIDTIHKWRSPKVVMCLNIYRLPSLLDTFEVLICEMAEEIGSVAHCFEHQKPGGGFLSLPYYILVFLYNSS